MEEKKKGVVVDSLGWESAGGDEVYPSAPPVEEGNEQTKEEKPQEEVVFARDSRGWGSEQKPKQAIFSSSSVGWGSKRELPQKKEGEGVPRQ